MNWVPVVWEFVKKIFEYIFSIKRRRAGDAITDSGVIAEIFRKLVMVEKNLNIDAVFLIKAHNGGSRLRPHDFIFRSIVTAYVDEEWMHDFKIEDYANLPVNSYYRMMLERLFKYGQYEIDTEHVDDKVLQHLYDFQKIKMSRYYFLVHDKKAMWYMSAVSTLEGNRMDSERHTLQLYLAVNKVKNIINKY